MSDVKSYFAVPTNVIIGAAVSLGVLGLAALAYRNINSAPARKVIPGPFHTLTPIKLEHQHPDGWGSGAIIKTMKSLPTQEACARIVEDLQKNGVALVENLYEDLCVEKLNYEVNDITAAELKKTYGGQ